jgi:hypothetical protein
MSINSAGFANYQHCRGPFSHRPSPPLAGGQQQLVESAATGDKGTIDAVT